VRAHPGGEFGASVRGESCLVVVALEAKNTVATTTKVGSRESGKLGFLAHIGYADDHLEQV